MEMTEADRLFVDINILVYATDSQSSFHLAAQQRLDEIRQHGTSMVISSQVLREYLAVTTRSSATGERVPLPEILTNIQIFRQEFEVVNENSAVFDQINASTGDDSRWGKAGSRRKHCCHYASQPDKVSVDSQYGRL
jgi:predicted nucleic acid-binding protein